MTIAIGFSTGALFRDQLALGVEASRRLGLRSVELSALRHRELAGLIAFAEANDLSDFLHVSVHAPTDFTPDMEESVISSLRPLATERHWFVVVHPDCMTRDDLWSQLGDRLCVENMDKRKPVGRTLEELRSLFTRFPDAGFCFDIGHAHQVDPSMTEACRILREFAYRICQLHVSEVTSSSKHDRLSKGVLEAFREVADLLPVNAPAILETPVDVKEAREEVRKVETLLQARTHAFA
jgi:hypothetical protein